MADVDAGIRPVDTGAYQVFSRRNLFRRLKRYKLLYLLLFPALAYFIIFKYVPMYGILIAFKDYKFTQGILGSSWAGMKHFSKMFSGGSFLEVFRNTIVISLSKLAFGFPAPIIFAILLNEIKKLKFKKTVQTISYLPHFVSWVVLAGIIREFLSTRGIINYLLVLLGGQARVFLTDAGIVLGRNGRLDESERYLVAAVKTDRENADAHFALGMLRQRQGKNEEALAGWKEALRLDPTHPDAARILEAAGR